MVSVKARGVGCPGTRGSDKESAGRRENKNRNELQVRAGANTGEAAKTREAGTRQPGTS